MYLSSSRLFRSGLAVAGVLAFAALASAAPPPGMRWGDHSGLAPSGGRGRPATTYSAPSYPRLGAPVVTSPVPAAGATTYYYYPAPSAGATTYYYYPRTYTPVPAPSVTWYYAPSPATVTYPSGPIVTTPSVVVPYASSPPVVIPPSR